MKRRGNFQRIDDDTARRISSKKRKAGLLKKVKELTILCDIEACIVLYDPAYHPEPDAWPSPREAAALLHRFLALPAYQRAQRCCDLRSALRIRADKMNKSLDKEFKAQSKLYFELLFSDCLRGSLRDVEDLSAEEIAALALLAEIKLAEIDAKIAALRSRRMNFNLSSLMAAPPTPPATDCRRDEEFCPAEGGFWNYNGVVCDFGRFSLMDPNSRFR